MASNELAIKFTETIYATKAEVSRELKMSIIDSIWANILKYRQDFNKILFLKTIDRNPLHICMCESIKGKIAKTDELFSKLVENFKKLDNENGETRQFVTNCFIKTLNSVAKRNHNEISEACIRTILNGTAKDLNPGDYFILQYLKGLKFIKNSTSNFNKDFLFKLYSVLSDKDISEVKFRDNNFEHDNDFFAQELIFNFAPAVQIESMINTLNLYLDNENNVLLKALNSFFYIGYIKPFPKFNEEIAALTCKFILSKSYGELAFMLPIEEILSSDAKSLSRIFNEVQRNCDITYFVNYSCQILNNILSTINDSIIRTRLTEVQNEMHQEDEIEESTTAVESEPVDVLDKVEDKPKLKPVIQTTQGNLATTYVAVRLNERQIKKFEEQLLESDASLSKKEAKFYARHCTLGKQYTIDQFKKSIGCVYETARTSMENLVNLGYYRKETVKNKFVYIPIQR